MLSLPSQSIASLRAIPQIYGPVAGFNGRNKLPGKHRPQRNRIICIIDVEACGPAAY